jgi:hypothetical protein
MRMSFRLPPWGRLVLAIAVSGMCGRPAAAQTISPPNSGLIHFQGGVDAPSLYVYRGVVQEGDAALTLTPWADLILCASDAGRLCVETGVWNSLHTGTSGTGGPLDALHYSQRFHANASLQINRFLTLSPGYLANSSPNGGYETIQEFNLLIASPRTPFAPYALVAFELSDSGQLDGGSARGRYLEIGATPVWRLDATRWQVTVPVKAGFSLSDYYELLEPDLRYVDSRFGFAQAGVRLTMRLTDRAARLGAWQLRGGGDVMTLGDTTRAFNRDKKTLVVGTFGVTLQY